MSRIFERELKNILRGDLTTLEKVTKNFGSDIQKQYSKIIENPFIVIRAAGSFGVDIVAIRHDFAFPIEVKSSSNDTIRFSVSSGRAKKQAEWLKKECKKAGLIPIYAFKLKNIRNEDAWRIFTIKTNKVEGRLKLIYELLPKISETASGNYAMRWEEGFPLHRFIDYLC